MITKEEVKHLAELARIDVSDGELDHLTSEIDSIIGYVGQINAVSTGEIKKEAGILRNVMRDDEVLNEPGQYTEDILKNAPQREGNWLKVKKIL